MSAMRWRSLRCRWRKFQRAIWRTRNGMTGFLSSVICSEVYLPTSPQRHWSQFARSGSRSRNWPCRWRVSSCRGAVVADERAVARAMRSNEANVVHAQLSTVMICQVGLAVALCQGAGRQSKLPLVAS